MPEQIVTTFVSAQMFSAKMRSAWEGRQVYVSASEDRIVIRKMEASDLWELRNRSKNSGMEFSVKNNDEAISYVRTKSYDKSHR